MVREILPGQYLLPNIREEKKEAKRLYLDPQWVPKNSPSSDISKDICKTREQFQVGFPKRNKKMNRKHKKRERQWPGDLRAVTNNHPVEKRKT